jgi:putative PIN family toxin of toxin-antitoxin system
MRVVLDTNVLVSAALKRQSMPGATAHIVEQHHRLLKSHVTEQQLFEVVARSYLATVIPADTQAWMRKLMTAAELVTITERIAACRDPTDDKFLELAVNGRADLIVSGDADLLALNPFRGIPVLSPAAFIQRVTNASRGISPATDRHRI